MEECQKWINSKIRWGSGTRYHLSFVIPRPWVPGPTQGPLTSALNSPLYGTASNTTIWPVQMAHLCTLTQLLSYGALGFTGTLKNTWGVARRALETKVPGNPVLKCLSSFRAVGDCTSSQGELLFLIFWKWTIFKVFILYWIYYSIISVLVWGVQSLWDLRSLTGDQTHTSCTGRQSLNPGVATEVLRTPSGWRQNVPRDEPFPFLFLMTLPLVFWSSFGKTVFLPHPARASSSWLLNNRASNAGRPPPPFPTSSVLQVITVATH